MIYGRESLSKLLSTLDNLYEQPEEGKIVLRNEFDEFYKTYVGHKNWRFTKMSLDEYIFHERRKLIWASYKDSSNMNREIKIEFEPIKDFGEIKDEYSNTKRISSLGWIVVEGEIVEDKDAYFMPSMYDLEVKKTIEGKLPGNGIERILSFVEEFRGQARVGDKVLVAGNLEKVEMKSKEFQQITLTYNDRYFDQVIKII